MAIGGSRHEGSAALRLEHFDLRCQIRLLALRVFQRLILRLRLRLRCHHLRCHVRNFAVQILQRLRLLPSALRSD